MLCDNRFADAAARALRLIPFADLTDGEIIDFLWRAGLEVVGSRPKIFSTKHPGELVADAHIALDEGLAVAQDWPAGFMGPLDRMRERWNTLRATTAVNRWLDRLEPGPGAAIRDAFTGWRECVRIWMPNK